MGQRHRNASVMIGCNDLATTRPEGNLVADAGGEAGHGDPVIGNGRDGAFGREQLKPADPFRQTPQSFR